MNRFQKKCLVASLSAHLVLFLILVVSSAFVFKKKEELVQVEPIPFVPAKLVDDLFASLSAPPPPSPVQAPAAPPARVEPPPPAPAPPPPKPAPEPKPVTPKPTPAPPPAEKPPPPRPRITPVFNAPAVNTQQQAAQAREAEQRRERERQAEAARLAQRLTQVEDRLRKSYSTLSLDVPGAAGEAYASYSQAIMKIYEQAWQTPGDGPRDSVVKVRVVVARDGRVIEDPITQRSGNAAVDSSVQAALNRVRQRGLPPFPTGATDAQRTFVINFNLK